MAIEENISKLISSVEIFKREALKSLANHKYRENYRVYEN